MIDSKKVTPAVEQEYQYNNVVETIKFEEILEEIKGETISKLDGPIYGSILGFVRENENDATFFKADFTPLFERKVGDEVSVIIGGKEYLGIIDNAYIQNSSELILKTDREYDSYDFTIRPYSQVKNKQYNYYIHISGIKSKDGYFKYNGSIKYEGEVERMFLITNEIGVIIPDSILSAYISRYAPPGPID